MPKTAASASSSIPAARTDSPRPAPDRSRARLHQHADPATPLGDDDRRDTGTSPSKGRIVPGEERAPLKVRLINLGAVGVPFLGVITAMVMAWGTALDWTHLIVFVALYLATGLGITVGFHRLFTHRSFKAPRPLELLLGVLGSMAVEGPLFEWVAGHRRHHQHSDDEGDPHSPHHHGDDLMGTLRGLWHAHAGWLFLKSSRELPRYVGDLRKDAGLRLVNDLFPVWVLLGLAIPTAIGGIVSGTWMGALLGFIWGGLVRVFVVHHITWSINSVCHIWGAQPFDNGDESRNNVLFGVLGFGEGWHNNHHAFPNSARHGLRWWQLDVSYLLIRGLGAIGLARDIRVPSAERLASKRTSERTSVDSTTEPK
mgnify:CR=1 FL=1